MQELPRLTVNASDERDHGGEQTIEPSDTSGSTVAAAIVVVVILRPPLPLPNHTLEHGKFEVIVLLKGEKPLLQ